MPIIGLTTQTQAGAGLPIVARLYKGSEKQEMQRGGRTVETVGKDLDYFRVEFEPQFAHLAELWNEMYGPEPREFAPIFLASSTVDEAFSTWKEEWGAAGTLLHRCDGEQQVQHWNAAAGVYSKARIACASPVNPATGAPTNPQCKCKSVGRLSVVLPEFVQESGVLGYVSIVTHSLNDILTVYRYLSDIQRLYGRLTGVPFVFGRADKEVSAPKQVKRDGGYVVDGRMKTTKSLFYIHVAPDFARQQMLIGITGAGAAAGLPSGQAEMVDGETGEIISVDEARQLLGSGGGSRRIGDTPVVEVVTPADAPRQPDAWTQFWDAWKRAGFAVDDKAAKAQILGIQTTYGQDAAEMMTRLNAYLERQKREVTDEPAG